MIKDYSDFYFALFEIGMALLVFVIAFGRKTPAKWQKHPGRYRFIGAFLGVIMLLFGIYILFYSMRLVYSSPFTYLRFL